jgi:hypothetical protein
LWHSRIAQPKFESVIFMGDFITRIKNKLWKIKNNNIPSFFEFHSPMKEEFSENYTGKIPQLFFTNKQDTVHKWLHYLPIYEKILSDRINSELKFLEIGVSKGGSMRLWRDFFGASAKIFGIDIDPQCAVYDGLSGSVRIGSQADPEFLRAVVREMGGLDVILDDGSHVSSHQRASFNTLFPLLAEGGLYIIEDMHTAYWPHFEGGLGRKGTAIEFLKEKIDWMHQHYWNKGLNTSEHIPEIESIQFFDSIAVIVKRRQLPRFHVQIPTQTVRRA